MVCSGSGSASCYCFDCYKLHLTEKIADNEGADSVMEDVDDQTSVSLSAHNLAVEQEHETEFLGEPKSEMRFQVKNQLQY